MIYTLYTADRHLCLFQDTKDQDSDDFEEISAYQKLVSSFVSGQASRKKKKTKKIDKNKRDSASERSTKDTLLVSPHS